LSTLETDVYFWCYALLVVYAIEEEEGYVAIAAMFLKMGLT